MESKVNEAPGFSDLIHLSAEKLQQLEVVLESILALPIAQETYAQIIDGERIRQPLLDSSTQGSSTEDSSAETAIVSDRPKPSSWAIQQYRKFMKDFVDTLKINTELAQRYQDAPLDSREHNLRLLEITAASLHALAGKMFASFHPNTELKPQKPPEGHYRAFRGTDRFYVDFFHAFYTQFEQYPFGLLNVVGYWAETQLLGGVLLFDRGDSGSEINNAFVQLPRSATCFELSTQQIVRFKDLSKPEDAPHSLSAEILLPFTREPDTHMENIQPRMGEPPLRIYKNDYDRLPPSKLPNWRCVTLVTNKPPEAG